MGLDKNSRLADVLKQAEREFLVNQMLDSLYKTELYIPEQEMINYYERNKENYIRGTREIRALTILVEDKNEANQIRRRVLRGENFEDVARELSLDYQRKNRIDMGYFSPGDVVPEIARKLFSNNYKIGSVTYPIKSDFGWHLFKIVDIRMPNKIREYEEVKEEIRTNIQAERKKQVYQNYITSLKSTVEIETNYKLLNKLIKTEQIISPEQMATSDSTTNMESSND